VRSWDRFSVYLTIGDEHMKGLESLLPRIIDPPGNSISGEFAKSENPKRRFVGDIKRKQNEEPGKLLGSSPLCLPCASLFLQPAEILRGVPFMVAGPCFPPRGIRAGWGESREPTHPDPRLKPRAGAGRTFGAYETFAL
jgi:hypothetical protein